MKTLYSNDDVDEHVVNLNYDGTSFWLAVDTELVDPRPKKVVTYNRVTPASIIFLILSCLVWAAIVQTT